MDVRHRTEPDIAALRVPPFDRYPAAAVRPLAAHADRLRVRAGTTLAHAGHRSAEFVVVLAGEVLVDGDPPARLGPGTQIGGPELLTGDRHPRTLVAGDDLEVLVLPAPAFRWAARTLPYFPN
jgi:CRP-like cAMP-binding protein